jgi:hypothetical protein
MMVNLGAPNTGTSKFLKQILTDWKGEIASNTTMVGDVHTRLSTKDSSLRQEIITETLDVNSTSGLRDLTDTHSSPGKAAEYTSISSAYSPGQISWEPTTRVLTNLRRLKS